MELNFPECCEVSSISRFTKCAQPGTKLEKPENEAIIEKNTATLVSQKQEMNRVGTEFHSERRYQQNERRKEIRRTAAITKKTGSM